jgi:serine protease Do
MSVYNKLRGQKFLSFTLVLFTLCLGVLLGTLLNTGVKAAKEQSFAPGATPLQIPSPVQLQNSFSTLAKSLEPSVVNISTEYIPKAKTQTQQRRNGMRRQFQQPDQQQEEDQQDGSGMQDFFQRFFNGGPGGGMQGPSDTPSASLGSGFVVDRAGYILTNNHVVEKASRVRVKFSNDPTEYEAKVIGTDQLTDLAVIKVDRPNRVAVKIGNSEAIQVGDWAVAIGSPFGFQATVTAGIISAKSRDIPGDASQFQHFLQTDAAINPGNSGGPLLNINGEVIGINTMIASRSGGYQGIGFAMPINTAVKVYNQIIHAGHVTRGSIGISFQPTETQNGRALLRAYGVKSGVFVRTVEPNGPADKAGLKTEDVITAINGKPIATGEDLVEIVADTPVGTNLSFNYLRNHQQETTSVTVGDRSKIFPTEMGRLAPGSPDEDTTEPTQARFGLGIRSMPQTLRDSMSFKEKGGILVDSVEPGSFAEDIGFAPKDIIVAVNRQPVASTEDFQNIQKSLKTGDAVAFRVFRNVGAGRNGNGGWQALFLAGTLPPSNQ